MCGILPIDISTIGTRQCATRRRLTIVCDLPVSISVDSLHHIVQEMVRIFQSYKVLLANDVYTVCPVLR